MRGIGVNLHLKDDTVVLQYKTITSIRSLFANLDVAFLRVLHLIPAQIVTEAPIVLLHNRFDSPELTTEKSLVTLEQKRWVIFLENLVPSLWLISLKSAVAWQLHAEDSDSPLHCDKSVLSAAFG